MRLARSSTLCSSLPPEHCFQAPLLRTTYTRSGATQALHSCYTAAVDSLSEPLCRVLGFADLWNASRGLLFRDRMWRPKLQNWRRTEEMWGAWLWWSSLHGTQRLAESHGLWPRCPECPGGGGAALQDGNSVDSPRVRYLLPVTDWKVWKGELNSKCWLK